MKVAVHSAATRRRVIRDATTQESAALSDYWGGGKPPPVKPLVIVGASNSTTNYVAQASHYAYRVANALGMPIVNSAVSGQRLQAMLDNIQAQVFDHSPAAVLILPGANAAAAAVEAGGTPSVADVAASETGIMRSYITAVRGAGIKLIALTPNLSELPEANVYLMAIAAALRTLCFDRSVACIDLTGLMAYHQSLGGSTFANWFVPSELDKYHLGIVGHGHIFDLIMKSQIKFA